MADENIKSVGPTHIHGIGSSTAIDTSSEIVDLAGLDCSSLIGGPFSWEHKNDQPNQLVGKILEYKKIFSEADCENENHKYFWDKCKTPYLYVMGRLFDDKKDSSRECAALFLDDAEHPDEHPMVGFSVEGSKVSKKGIIVDKSIARRITVTNCPANKQCIAEIVKNPNIKPDLDEDSIFKSEPSHTIELLEKYEPLNKAGMFTSRGERIPARELQQPNIRTDSAKAKTWKQGGFPEKGLSGTSIGQGESVREGNIPEAREAAGRALRYQQRLPKPNLPKSESNPKPLNKAIKGAPGWSHSGGGNFSHPEHGVISVVKQGPEFHVKHGGKLAGVGGKKGTFSSAKEAGAHAGEYMRGLSQKKVLPTKMHDRPSPTMTKAMTAGSGMASPANLVQGAALAPESMDKKMKKALWFRKAEEMYQLWEKREQFESFMAKHLPSLTRGEIQAIGQTLALRKSLRAEKKLRKIMVDTGQDSWVKKKEPTK